MVYVGGLRTSPLLEPIAPVATADVAPSAPEIEASAQRVARLAARERSLQSPPSFRQMVTRGGGSEALAERLWTEGIDAAGAVDALSLAMRSPRVEDFPQARLVTEILSWARSEGQIDAERVQWAFWTLGRGVVIRPDGVWARGATGRPLESNRLEVKDGRLMAGGLPVGGLYHSVDNVLLEAGPGGAVGPVTGPQIGLQHDAANALLDGAVELALEAARGLGELAYGLAHEPEATLTALVHLAGGLPEQAVELVFESPEMLRRYQRLPRQDRLRVAGKVLASALLALRGAGAAGAAGRAAGGGGGTTTFRVGLADLGHGRTIPWLTADGLAVTGPGGAALGAGALGLGHLRELDGDPGDPKIRFANDHHVGRTYGDPRSTGASVDEIEAAFELLEDARPNTQRSYGGMALEHLQHLGDVPLADVARLVKRADRLTPEVRADVRRWALNRFRADIDGLDALPTKLRQRNRAAEIRRRADEAGVDLREAYRRGGTPPPRHTLSTEAQEAMKRIDAGTEELHVTSREAAEEILSQYPDLAETGGWPKWKTKALFADEFDRTYHWDDVRGRDGRVVGHGMDNPHGHAPHLQLHVEDEVVHVFFPWPGGER